MIRNELSTQKLCLGNYRLPNQGFSSYMNDRDMDAVRPNAGGEGSAHSLDTEEVTIRKMNVSPAGDRLFSGLVNTEGTPLLSDPS